MPNMNKMEIKEWDDFDHFHNWNSKNEECDGTKKVAQA